ncbi:DegT/DnrJ/EryC1/StrS family aminotransferase [Citrobacter sp. RHB25-C09]|uniref:DegT/DnrJ/EryC1/StrS family aminotransferase n=1 Tax=Citrobacter sp. RHB25-C09 TaxID=2742624 RepID=UPI0015EF25E7|nr:DegT/DnrJ/EryC1/StrS family aminotransferase [Citrobacter sp. RHB25-C09]QMI05545.1 DegT/DnrJ/EryC1/StrS aminotransferase family protein [Citrobacter sp. RHB25-C09]
MKWKRRRYAESNNNSRALPLGEYDERPGFCYQPPKLFAGSYSFILKKDKYAINSMYRHFPSAQAQNLPMASEIAERILCLPMFPELSDTDQQSIAELIRIHALARTENRICV